MIVAIERINLTHSTGSFLRLAQEKLKVIVWVEDSTEDLVIEAYSCDTSLEVAETVKRLEPLGEVFQSVEYRA